MASFVRSVHCGIAIWLVASIASAQAHSSSLPVLTAFVDATTPEGREAEHAAVLLVIVVATDGTVESADVAESGGTEFDEVALAAARRFAFTPAMRDGAPVRARIRYRYEFVPVFMPPDNPYPSEPELHAEDPVLPVEEVVLDDDEVPTYQATGVVYLAPRDGASHRLEGDALTQMAGTRGDALRGAELLPGVGRPAFGLGVLLVRGAAPQESQYFLDGVPVPLPFHFGGITSFFSSRLLQGFDLMLSNFGVRYGRATGGILQIEPRDPRTDRVHALLDVNVIDASASVEGPIGQQLSIAIAVRRSYIDAILSALQLAGLGVAPAYYDYQVILAWHPDASNRVRAMGYGSDDQLVPIAPPDPNATSSSALGLDNQFHRVQLEWRHDYSAAVHHEITLSLGHDFTQTVLGTFRLTNTQWPIIARAEWQAQVSDAVRIALGLDLQVIPYHLSFVFQSSGGPTEDPSQRSDDHRVRDTPVVRPAFYAESQLTLGPLLDVVLGARFDLYTEIARGTAAPRLTTRWHLHEAVDLRAGVGLFTQAPDIQQTLPNTGNPHLGPIYAIHTDVGFDIRLPANLRLSIDGFYRHVLDRAVAPGINTGLGASALGMEIAGATGVSFGATSGLTNEGVGRSYGLEIGARITPSADIPLIGLLSYTLMRNEWLDHPGQSWHVSPFDQTHVFTLALTWQIGEGFELGATMRLVSGYPYTAMTGSIGDLSTGDYRPVFGSLMGARNPLYHRLDVRVQKRFQIGDVGLTIYLDVQNVYNQLNQEGRSCNYDCTQTTLVPSLPIIPSLGLRGEL